MKKFFSLFSVGLLLASAAPVFAASSSVVSIGSVSPGTATVNAPATLSAPVSSPNGISTCNLYIDNDDKGAMMVSYGTASISYVFPSAQIYTAFVFCRDGSGNFNSGPNTSVWAQAPVGGGGGGGDITPPVIGSLSPTSAIAGQATSFTVSVSDSGGVSGCSLFISNVSQGAMSVISNQATKSYTFASAGSYSAYVQCKDAALNTGTGSSIVVSVSPAPTQNQPSASVQGALIKLECPTGAATDHPCKAVYYKGADGKRHAFPNEHVFFSWYTDFSTVKEVSSIEMAALTLGKNVPYRPGSRMVKFPSVPQVYAVSKGGVLRWIKTEADAKAIYGADWSKKVDDISEAFFMDYKYGADITPSAPFDVAAEINGAQTIDAAM